MNTLYEITENYKSVLAMAENAETDEDLQVMQDTLAAINDAAEVKFDAYGTLITEWQARADFLKSEEEKLKKRRERLKKSVDRLKERAFEYLVQTGKPVKTAHFNWALKGKRPSVEILDLEQLPDEYKTEKVTVAADKTALYAALKDGKVIPGAKLGDDDKKVVF